MSTWLIIPIAVFFFYLGGIIGLHSKRRLFSKMGYDGIISVTRDGRKILYSLELNDDPEKLEHMREVLFKVKKVEIPGVELNRN